MTRRRTQKRSEGFTLIELLLVVAMAGVVAVLGSYGVRKYLAATRSAEATNTVRAINRSAAGAFDRTGQLCQSSTAVPTIVPSRREHVPSATDYHVPGEPPDTGWTCLRFEVTEPQHFQYKYDKGPASTIAKLVPSQGKVDWVASAVGDLDGDGVLSNFVTGGSIDLETGHPLMLLGVEVADRED